MKNIKTLEHICNFLILGLALYAVLQEQEAVYRVILPIMAGVSWIIAGLGIYGYTHRAPQGGSTPLSKMLIGITLALVFTMGAAYYWFFL
jgi:hypothetical protein